MASSAKYTPLDTAHLRSQDPSEETTMQSLIDASEHLAQEALEVMPYAFDECTYQKGYLRQSIWSCLDCGEKGVCYGCSISCHSDHRLVELWTKRHFRCDCATDMNPSSSTSTFTTKRRRCTLNPPEIQPADPNEENRYQHNFSGQFCRCGRSYDPEIETEAMINCIACEDWYHESCLNLASRKPVKEVQEGEDEDEDEEKDVLIPSDSYDGLLCARCAEGCEIAKCCRGKDGWMTIEPKEGEGGGWVVRGRKETKEENIEDSKDKKDINGSEVKSEDPRGAPVGVASSVEIDTAKVELGIKRVAEDTVEDKGVKKIKIEDNSSTAKDVKPTDSQDVKPTDSQDVKAMDSKDVKPTDSKDVKSTELKGAGDIFLADGIRERLKSTLSSAEIASLPFPLVDEEIYEPPRDTDPETLDQVTNRVVGSLPRVQAIEALHGYQNMKEGLKVLLSGRAERGEIVTRDDIEGFFADLKGRARL
ncbi:hypothetical protein BCR39DRAFT_265315 [Naematelia encephala]|uniref:UBR-type domain-containing protein n=1 Tax=Naematelia encephala TaxID=71784 RepID=A0A1Y2BFX1_9TREE|nr:hypothetical protein BCR39DRAFT_265315 [Naematelia encephala]